MRPLWKGILIAWAGLALVAGCSKNKGEGAVDPQSLDPASALVEERDDGKLEWIVSPEGQVLVKVTLNEGEAKGMAGALLVDGQSYPMTAQAAGLTAALPKLTGDLTTIAYSLKVGDATWDGALHVPPGGTKELVAVPSVSVPEGTKGPHGGALDVVGDQRVEVVIDQKTGEVRVYLLDEKLQPMPVGTATAVMGFVQAPGQAAAAPTAAPAAPNTQSPSLGEEPPKAQ